jgi:hypothetical protein
LGAEARFEFDDLFAGFGVGLRLVDPAGEIEEFDWYPDATAIGIDVTIYTGIRLNQSLALIAGFELRRYAFAANSLPGDPRVVGGGVDEYPAGFAALEVTLPGNKKAPTGF